MASSPGADAAAKIPVQLLSLADPSQSWSAEMVGGESVRFRLVPPGAYRVISGDVEQRVEVASGDEVTIDVGQRAASDRRDVRVTARDRTAYGTRFNAAALELLPQSNGVYGLIERSDPLVITERMEGGGTYPEPQRMGASGASWTQTTFKLGDADITDPDRTGFAMLYPNLDTLEAVSVTTAGISSGRLREREPPSLWCRACPSSNWHAHGAIRCVAAGVSVGEPAPGGRRPSRGCAARVGGSFVVERTGDRRASGSRWPARSTSTTRLERERRRPLPSRAQSCRRTSPTKPTQRDDVRLFAQTDRLSFPAIGRAMLVDPGLAAARALDAARHHLESRDPRRSRLVGEPDLRPRRRLTRRWPARPIAGTDRAAARRAGVRAGLGDRELAVNGRRCTGAASPGPVQFLGTASPPGIRRQRLVDGATAAGAGRLAHRRAGGWRSRRGCGNTPPTAASSQWRGNEFALWATDEIPVMSRVDIDLGDPRGVGRRLACR